MWRIREWSGYGEYLNRIFICILTKQLFCIDIMWKHKPDI